MGNTVDFVTKFHSLEGNLLGERKKNFSKFLRELASAGDQQIELFFKDLDPQTYLEKHFKVDALIYFKRTSEMLDILKGDNDIYRAKVMKQQWIFENAFKNVDAESLVNEFIPQLSFKDRRKFVNKVLRTMNEKLADLVFDALYRRYGLSFAKHFLHFCSTEKIKNFLQREEVSLDPNQMIHLFNKNEELFVNYLDYYKATFNKVCNERKVIDHIALINLELVINLHRVGKITVERLGKRTSKRGFEIMKNDIIQNKCNTILNKNVMFRKLGSNFKSYYYDHFPKFYSHLNVNHEFLVLKSIPKIKRWPTFSEAFSKRFPNQFIEDDYMWRLIKFCPDRNIIKARALGQYYKGKNEQWLKYMDPKISIPLIKQKISLSSSIRERRRYVELLIETCAENKDFLSFEAVLKYICHCHRNEIYQFRSLILNKIKASFNLQELNENHWIYLNEQIKVQRIQKQFNFDQDFPFVEEYLQYLFRNKKDFTATLQEYVQDIIQYNIFDLTNKKDPETMQAILVEFLKTIGTIGTSNRLDYRIISSMITFNELYPEHKVAYSNFHKFNQSVVDIFQKTSDVGYSERELIEQIILHKIKFPEILPTITNDAIRQAIFNVALQPRGGYLLSKVLNSFILKKSRTTFENDLMVAYFEQLFNKHPDSNVVNWYLINEPQAIVEYFPKIVSHFLKKFSYLNLPLIKNYSHFKFDMQVIDYLKKRLISVAYEDKFSCISQLKTMLNSDEFAQIISSQFLPEKEKLDLTDEKMMEMYRLQCDIAKILHKIEEPDKILQIVLKFCVGDYLQSALPSLYGVFYKLPEIKLYNCIEVLSERAVSVNKHAVFLSCELLTREFIITILANTKHTNVSSQKHLFSAALKYFQKNPSETLLNIVIDTMTTIDKNDEEILHSLVDATIPEPFKVPYTEKCWTFYESLELQGVDVENYLASVVYHLLNDMYLLKNVSTTFTTNILNSCLPSEKIYNITEFAAKVLIYREYNRMENFDLIFEIISTKGPTKARDFLNCFAEEKLDTKFINLLDKYWHQYLTLIDNFWGHLFLKLWLIDVAKASEEKFAEDVVTYLEQIILEYGYQSFNLFQNVFQRFLNKENDQYKYKLFHNILNYKITTNNCILILNTMDPVKSRGCEHTEVFRKILGIIRNIKEPIVCIYYSKYVSDHDVKIQ